MTSAGTAEQPSSQALFSRGHIDTGATGSETDPGAQREGHEPEKFGPDDSVTE